MKKLVSTLFHQLKETLFPRYCLICRKLLCEQEHFFCLCCQLQLPYTQLKGAKNNFIERMLWTDIITTERANSLFYYQEHSNISQIILSFKYHNQPELAVYCGKLMAQDLLETDFFQGIDLLIPVPLAKERFKQRGYNQSERLAFGINQLTHIPIENQAFIRKVNTQTQTHLSMEERSHNVVDIFQLMQPERIKGKHLLLIDDVCTTGSTIRSLAQEALTAADDVKISVLTLAVTRYNRNFLFPSDIF